jgi:hypothetical protein
MQHQRMRKTTQWSDNLGSFVMTKQGAVNHALDSNQIFQEFTKKSLIQLAIQNKNIFRKSPLQICLLLHFFKYITIIQKF